jgi:hypothetical protein
MRLVSSLLIRGREVSSCFHQGYEPAARLNNCTWDSRSIEPRVRCGSRLPRPRVDRSHSALGIRLGTRGPPRARSISPTRHAIDRSLRVVVMPATAEPLRLPRH